MLTEARSQTFTEVTLYEDPRHVRAIGYGSTNWSVICPTPEELTYPEPSSGTAGISEVPPLREAYHGRRRSDTLLEIPGLLTLVTPARVGPFVAIPIFVAAAIYSIATFTQT